MEQVPDRVAAVITLGAPHEGSPLAFLTVNDCSGLLVASSPTTRSACEFVKGLRANPIAKTAGALDLRNPDEYLTESHGGEIISLGGRVDDWTQISNGELILPWLLLTLAQIDSDGIVPVHSAIPAWTNALGIFPKYDHSEMSRGEGYALESDLFENLRSILKALHPQARRSLVLVGSGVVLDDFFGFRFVGPSDLYSIEITPNGRDFRVGRVRNAQGEDITVTDVAVNNDGQIYAVTDDRGLYVLRPHSTVADRIATLNTSSIVSLDFDPQGHLYAATSTELVTVNIQDGKIDRIGLLGNGITPSGDIVFSPDGRLFGAAYAPASGNKNESVLIEINPTTGRAATIGTGMGVEFVFGLLYRDKLYGVTSRGDEGPGLLVSVNTQNGIATTIRSLSFDAFGASGSRDPIGQIDAN